MFNYQVMALIRNQTLGHNIWTDVFLKSRTITGLVRKCNQNVKDGKWVGWRLIEIKHQAIGQIGLGNVGEVADRLIAERLTKHAANELFAAMRNEQEKESK